MFALTEIFKSIVRVVFGYEGKTSDLKVVSQGGK